MMQPSSCITPVKLLTMARRRGLDTSSAGRIDGMVHEIIAHRLLLVTCLASK